MVLGEQMREGESSGMLANPAERFSGRVESYRRFRPGYPARIVDLLRREFGLHSDAAIADVAAGTGLLTEIFLAAGLAVTAVEPNAEMRAACSALGSHHQKLTVVDGSAEATGLADASVDLISVGQAIHWFNLEHTRAEFARVLKPGGGCAVVYNDRRMSGDVFHDGYERLLREFGIDYIKVARQHMTEDRLRSFFAPEEMRRAVFPNEQFLTLEGLMGRVLSSSYMPQPGQERFEEMEKAVEKLFAESARDGVVRMEYECVVSYGKLPPAQ